MIQFSHRLPPFDPKVSPIFKGFTAAVSQISSKDVKKLWTLLLLHGGKLKPQLDSSCTHLICGKATGVSKQYFLVFKCYFNIFFISLEQV